MTSKKVVVTGVTSFTGCYIARTFIEAGWEVHATLTQKLESYEQPFLQDRIQFSNVTQFLEDSAFGTENFLESLNFLKPNLYINHGASIKGYRDPSFDVKNTVCESTRGLDQVFETLAKLKCSVVHSGSIFESDSEQQWPNYSNYGKAKTEVWEKFIECAKRFQVPLSKIIIPDPVGAYENRDRLGPVLFMKWLKGESAIIHNPEVVWDRIPAAWLARFYLRAATDGTDIRTFRPSAFAESNRKWAERLKAVFEKKTGKKAQVQETGSSHDSRTNNDKCPELNDHRHLELFVDEYSTWLLQN